MNDLLLLYPFFPLIGWGLLVAVVQGCMYRHYRITVTQLTERISLLETATQSSPEPSAPYDIF
jgi:hypothetical protein